MKYLLDTNICVFFIRGKYNLYTIFREKGIENCSISELTVFELKFGAENSSDPIKSHWVVNEFIKRFSIIPISEIADKYAEIKVKLRKNGTPMHDEFDLMIGVTALQNRMTLVTDNLKDFRFIEGLITENWIVREN
ncbi:PIN domain protein [Capnocytophaga sp. oral taxon 863 str. F0517]|uniref:PIN domain-containing protein n=1 Tax=Capnocytophaga sp. oral taxon 863 TaxID=1227265 RepID=UPI000396223C|nr:PIN domain-containing protein [Capnocytophaga sp. oral taxon 863]ERI63252.1 PIN domain protein [Capnocytophaga sp. oral taxon 863 str. F0517]